MMAPTSTSTSSPDTRSPLLSLSALELARRIRLQQVSAREVLEVHLALLQQANPILNALVADRFSAARDEADEIEYRIKSGYYTSFPPLLGVPFSVKECFALTGMPQSSGLLARRNVIATVDATAVARLRAAGAIPVGVSNTSELCMWMESRNPVYGRTNNPYDLRHTPGGSSGGEGALVGVGAVPFGLGADVGGSIRMPAFFNGVFGHKPTGGGVPNTGQYPIAHGPALRYLTTGPLARRAADLMPLLRILAGPDGLDSGCVELSLDDPGTVDIASLKVLDVIPPRALRVHPDLSRAQQDAARALAARGATITRIEISGLEKALEIWSAMLASAGGPRFKELLGNGIPVRGWLELFRWCVGRSPHTLPAIGLVLLEELLQGLSLRVERSLALGQRLRRTLEDLLDDRTVLLFPSHRAPAPRHLKPLFPPFNWVYTAIFNVMELPVTQVPTGLNARGLPVGVQVVGPHGRDQVPIAVALELEQALGGWRPPEGWRKRLPR